MKNALFIFIALLFHSCENQKDVEPEKIVDTTEAIKPREPEYSVVATQNPEMDWGYQLFKDGKLMIDQKHIPAIQGNKGFSTKEDAEKIANYILEKVKKGAFPPTVSVEELDSLGVIN